MKKDKVITLITIIAAIAVAGVFFGVYYLVDVYVQQQKATQSAAIFCALQSLLLLLI